MEGERKGEGMEERTEGRETDRKTGAKPVGVTQTGKMIKGKRQTGTKVHWH